MRIPFKVFALSCLCIIFLSLPAQAANDVPKAVLDLRNSVVRIVCETDDGGYTGSGFAIGEEEPIRYIVTNYHVVAENPDGLWVLRSGGERIKATVLTQLPAADLCVVELDQALYIPPVVLDDGEGVDAGQGIYTLGFPGATISPTSCRLTLRMSRLQTASSAPSSS